MASSTKAALVVIVAFVAGLIAGVAGYHFHLVRTGRIFPRRGTEFVAHHIVDHLNRELHLSDAQRVAIQRIIDDRHARIDAIWNNVRPQVHQQVDAASADIEKVLTPEQRVKFREMRSRASRRGRRGGTPPF